MKRSPTATTTNDLRATARRALDARLRDLAAARLGADQPTDERTTERLLTRVLAAIDKHLAPDAETASALNEAEVVAFVERMRLDELRLVVRCEAGDEAAWRELIAEFTPTVRAAARQACGAAGVEADDFAASVWADLYGSGSAADVTTDDVGDQISTHVPTERKSKLAYYSGCGSLGGWLRAVVAQLAVDRSRRTRRLVQLEDETSDDTANPSVSATIRAASVRSSPPTPEQIAIERQADDLLARTLRRAVAELPAADGLLLRLYYIDGLRLREAGIALGCSEATASRRLNALHKSIRERTTATLETEAGMNARQIADLFAAAAARPGADVRRWLAPASNDVTSDAD